MRAGPEACVLKRPRPVRIKAACNLLSTGRCVTPYSARRPSSAESPTDTIRLSAFDTCDIPSSAAAVLDLRTCTTSSSSNECDNPHLQSTQHTVYQQGYMCADKMHRHIADVQTERAGMHFCSGTSARWHAHDLLTHSFNAYGAHRCGLCLAEHPQTRAYLHSNSI
jgi:hypothetical protein